MESLQFLKKVLPSEGLYAMVTISAGVRQKFFNSVEELAYGCTQLTQAQTGENIYFALSSFNTAENRKHDNVNSTKVIALDIDCGEGKPYPSWKEGLPAVGDFITNTGLPAPMIVFSGSGLHVYFVLSEALQPTRWKPLAENVKQLCLTNGLHIDPSVTADLSRILRPLDTINTKNGNQVALIIDAPEIDPATLEILTNTKPIRTNSAVSLGSLKAEYEPANAPVIMSKCAQVAWAVKNQEQVKEPMWYALMGIAAFCHDAEDVAKAWSCKHPEYDEVKVLEKMAAWKAATSGPTTCKKFESERPEGCKGCKLRGSITSPANVSRTFVATTLTEDDVLDKTALGTPVPATFKRTNAGIKMTLEDVEVDVCPFDVYPVSYGMDEARGYEVSRYHWRRPHIGWQELTLRQAYLNDGNKEFGSVIADQGILLSNRVLTERFQMFLRYYMDELKKQQTVTNQRAIMGWTEDRKAFVLGDVIYSREDDGTVSTLEAGLSAGVSSQVETMFKTKGSIHDWIDVTSYMAEADLNAQMFSLGVAFSSPLYTFTGLKGLTFSLYGPTGGGKTLAQLWAQSIYGDPDKLHYSAKYTQNSLFSRLGMLSNIVMTIDEVTIMDKKEVGDFCFLVSQGRDKARLNRQSEEKEPKTWATPVVVSTNISLQSKLVASGIDADAQAARLLEVQVPQTPILMNNPEAGRLIHKLIHENYGHPGHHYIKNLVTLGEDALRQLIDEATQGFEAKYGVVFKGEERFWQQAVVLANLGLELAKQWGLIKFEPRQCIEWVLEQIENTRVNAIENHTDGFDTLAEYVTSFSGEEVVILHTAGSKTVQDFSKQTPRDSIRIRVDLYRPNIAAAYDKGTMLIDRAHFTKWLASKGVDFRSFKQEMDQHNVLSIPTSGKATLSKDTPIRTPQVRVIGFNLSHPRLHDMLGRDEAAVEDTTRTKLKLV